MSCFLPYRRSFETSFSKDGMLYHFSLSQPNNSDTIRYFETGEKLIKELRFHHKAHVCMKKLFSLPFIYKN